MVMGPSNSNKDKESNDSISTNDKSNIILHDSKSNFPLWKSSLIKKLNSKQVGLVMDIEIPVSEINAYDKLKPMEKLRLHADISSATSSKSKKGGKVKGGKGSHAMKLRSMKGIDEVKEILAEIEKLQHELNDTITKSNKEKLKEEKIDEDLLIDLSQKTR